MGELFKQLKSIWQGFGKGQKLLVGGGTALVALSLLAAVALAGGTEYRMVASDLDQKSAQKAVGKLEEAGIAYKLSAEGDALMVDVRKLPEARILLFKEGIGSAGVEGPGYAGLGETTMSMTEAQRREWMRVLKEQELARTIRSYYAAVRRAVVHLTPPVRRSFRKGDEPGKGVVNIQNVPGSYLDAGQVQAIQVLVANAAEGLEPRRVAVIDSSGHNLARNPSQGGTNGFWTVAREAREEALQRKLSTALTRVLGSDDVKVRVALDLDLERLESTDKNIDTGSKALTREKVESAENSPARPGGESSTSAVQSGKSKSSRGGGLASKTEKVESDYDYSTRTVHAVKEAGAIRRMSVAVFVNNNPQAGVDRSSMKQELEAVARAAVGLDEKRGDTFVLTLVPFKPTEKAAPPPAPGVLENPVYRQWIQWGTAALLSLGVLLFFMRSAKKARLGLKEALREDTSCDSADGPSESGTGEVKPPDPKEEIVKVIESNPEAVGRLLRNWMYESVK